MFNCLNLTDIYDYYLSEFLRRSLIFIIKGFPTIVFIFIIISTKFRPICAPAFSTCLSNSGAYTELQTTSFIESMGVACSDYVNHNRVQVYKKMWIWAQVKNHT